MCLKSRRGAWSVRCVLSIASFLNWAHVSPFSGVAPFAQRISRREIDKWGWIPERGIPFLCFLSPFLLSALNHRVSWCAQTQRHVGDASAQRGREKRSFLSNPPPVSPSGPHRCAGPLVFALGRLRAVSSSSILFYLVVFILLFFVSFFDL